MDDRRDATPAVSLVHRGTTQLILSAFFDVYNELGRGFLESVYRRAMDIELASRRVDSVEEALLEVHFKGRSVGVFRADLSWLIVSWSRSRPLQC